MIYQRKHPELWQQYLTWIDLMKMRTRHTNRMKSALAGRSNLVAQLEQDTIDLLDLDIHVSPKTKADRENSIFSNVVEWGKKAGPIWDYLVDHKGIGERMAAPLIAQIDDIYRFDTVSKLWRFSGYGVGQYWINDKGKIQCPVSGWKRVMIKEVPYRVWTICHKIRETQYWNVIKNETYVVDDQNYHDSDMPHYTDNINQRLEITHAISYVPDRDPVERVDYIEPKPEWKMVQLSDRLVEGYHSPFNRVLKSLLWNIRESFIKQQTPFYSDLYYEEKKRLRLKYPEKIKENGKWKYNDAHLHNMAQRKMIKKFLANLWEVWREFDK